MNNYFLNPEKNKNLKLGLILNVSAVILATIVSMYFFGVGKSGSIGSYFGGEVLLPFFIAGFVAALLVLFLTPKANIIGSLVALIIFSGASFYYAMLQERNEARARNTQIAKDRFASCQDAYNKNKDLFKVTNFTAEPVRDEKTGKITAMKVGFDSNLNEAWFKDVKILAETANKSLVFRSSDKSSESILKDNRYQATLTLISPDAPKDTQHLRVLIQLSQQSIIADTSYADTSNSNFNCKTDSNSKLSEITYLQPLSVDVKFTDQK